MDNHQNQFETNAETRTIVVDWLVEVCQEYKLQHVTLHLGITLFDKYLSLKTVTKKNIQAIGIICLILASKIEEMYPVTMDDAKYISADAYTIDHLVKTEISILEEFNYVIQYETMIPHIKSICIKNALKKSDYYFSIFIAACTLLNGKYMIFPVDILAKKIVEFCLLQNMNQVVIERIIRGDPYYSYLYYAWRETYNSKYEGIKNIFSEDHLKISLLFFQQKPPDTQICSYTNLFLQHNKENLMDTEELNFCIYPKDVFDNKIKISNLGSGSYGSVNHVKILDKSIALKTIPKFCDCGGIDPLMVREINSLAVLNHPNIIKMHGIYYNNVSEELHIGTDLVDTTLYHHFNSKIINYETKISYIKQILEGIKYIHSKNIMHRDLSPTNILVSKNGDIKICDFGSSRNFYCSGYSNTYSLEMCSLYFRPIELLLGKSSYTCMVDIWSCACIIGFILCDAYLFTGNNISDVVLNIFKILGTPVPGFNEELRLWPDFDKETNVYPRCGFAKLDTMYPNQAEILYKMLEYNPEKRIPISLVLDLFLESFKMTINNKLKYTYIL